MKSNMHSTIDAVVEAQERRLPSVALKCQPSLAFSNLAAYVSNGTVTCPAASIVSLTRLAKYSKDGGKDQNWESPPKIQSAPLKLDVVRMSCSRESQNSCPGSVSNIRQFTGSMKSLKAT